ncbi:L,D-transpeptidase [Rhizobium sp. SEMIA 4085]|uniref:L,D-transpeptidase domain-containing protein n=1 Tax=Rhizobium gallicum bv. gallicum R602sp TaxID=1041138 RepID=A0A0B4XG57_9HYPH|nr:MULTISPECIES: L,D-transpeptidase [Rhizobium]AJD46056.1 L,D-transpeptidase domain-containing protein [Rhizobium gallicum bv. gallicum R602sp]NNH29963.1 L,D-transpeptidase [Rhizobium sp. SEMIA 4085]TDW32347.1 L,D-transpeptidase-like protein [Rhizobium azibense]
MSELRALTRRAMGGLLCTVLLSTAINHAAADQASPPLLDKKNDKVWIDSGYIGFLMSPPAYPSRRAQGEGSYPHAGTFVRRHIVDYQTREAPGTIIIETRKYALYYIEAGGKALRYSVGVGREGYGWRGTEVVSAKRPWPDWRPPADMRKRRRDLPAYMTGGTDNPLGARAIYLGNTLYRIHGTNEPQSVGRSSSSGCFRMTNDDIIHLYERVKIGVKVIVL